MVINYDYKNNYVFAIFSEKDYSRNRDPCVFNIQEKIKAANKFSLILGDAVY